MKPRERLEALIKLVERGTAGMSVREAMERAFADGVDHCNRNAIEHAESVARNLSDPEYVASGRAAWELDDAMPDPLEDLVGRPGTLKPLKAISVANMSNMTPRRREKEA